MSGHTKGPWKATQIKEGLFHIERAVTSSGAKWVPIAVIDHSRDGHEPTRTITAPANANLIVAAPDLLEALKAMDRFLEDTGHGIGPIRASAREAIAKAEGEL